MGTPTSPEPQAKRRLPLDEALKAIQASDLSDEVVGGLSDLDRAGAAALGRVWPTLSMTRREELVRRAVESAETDVSRDFGRLLRVCLGDESAAIRQLAVLGLWEDTRSDLLPLLTEVAEVDPVHDVRAAAVGTLGGLLEDHGAEAFNEDDVERLRDLLLELAGDESDLSILRRAAVAAVGGFADDEEAAEIVAFAATEDDSAIRAAALHSMGTSRDGRWTPQVSEGLGSDDADVRAAALRAVGLIGLSDAVETVVASASDPDDEVRMAAISALGALGDQPSIRALRTLLQDPRMSDIPALEAALDEAMVGSDPARGGW